MVQMCKCLRDSKVVGIDDKKAINTTSPVFKDKVIPTYLAPFETIDARSGFELLFWA